MKKENRAVDIILNIIGFIASSAFNIFLLIVTMALIYTAVTKSFDYGKMILQEKASQKPSKKVVIEVPEDADYFEIANILKEHGLIDNQYLFMLQARLNGTYNLFRSGEFALNLNMNTTDLMEVLQQAPVQENTTDIKVTIPEGLTIKQIADLLESKGMFTAEEFIESCNTSTFNYSFVDDLPKRDNRLEGYLFPDTYFFSISNTPEEVIKKMLNRFDEVYSYDLKVRTEDLGLTIDQVVTIAAIIEREIVQENERVFASAVIHNRLEQGGPLEMCSTVMYTLNKGKDRLLLVDLETDSPYNTYKYPGLPIGPISNPGAASIKAALYPAAENYMFFVLKDDESGEHFFTNDYNEFLDAKERYNQQF